MLSGQIQQSVLMRPALSLQSGVEKSCIIAHFIHVDSGFALPSSAPFQKFSTANEVETPFGLDEPSLPGNASSPGFYPGLQISHFSNQSRIGLVAAQDRLTMGIAIGGNQAGVD
jgi:hypothetical protein